MMKKIIVIILAAVGAYWVSQTNDFAVWFNSDEFYHPIFSSELDVSKSGSTVSAVLNERYDVRHAFSLVVPYDDNRFDDFNNLDGRIRYTFTSNDTVLESKTISIPARPSVGLNKHFEIPLFSFDLPFEGYDQVHLEVVVVSPITKLEKYRGRIGCEVSTDYWPK